jgi:predicted Zn-dependent protease
MSLDNDTHELLSLLAYTYLENNHPEKAAPLLQALHALGITTQKEQTMLALALLRCGKAESSLNHLNEQALNGKVDATYYLVRSQTLHALDRRAEAKTAMQTYVRLRSTTPTPTTIDLL